MNEDQNFIYLSTLYSLALTSSHFSSFNPSLFGANLIIDSCEFNTCELQWKQIGPKWN